MGYEYNINSKARATGENSAAKSETKREAYNPSMHVNGKDTVSFKGATVSGASVAGFTGGIKKAASGAAANISGTLKTAATVAIAGLGLGAAVKSVQSSQSAVTVETPTTSTAEPSVIPTVQAVPVQISAQPAQNVQSSSQTTEQSAKASEKTTAGSLSQGAIYANSSVILNGSKSDAVDTTKNLTTEQTTEANAKPAAAAPSTIAFSTAVPVQISAQPAQKVQSAAVHKEMTVAKPARNVQPATVQTAATKTEANTQTARNTQPAAGQTEKAGFLNFRAKVELPTNNVASEKSDKDVSFEEKKAEFEDKVAKQYSNLSREAQGYADMICAGINEQNIDFVDDVIFKQGSLSESRIRAAALFLPDLNSENKEFAKELICNVRSLQSVEYIVKPCDTDEKKDFIRDLMGSGITDAGDLYYISSKFEQNFKSMKNVYAELKSFLESLTDKDDYFEKHKSYNIWQIFDSTNSDVEEALIEIISLLKTGENRSCHDFEYLSDLCYNLNKDTISFVLDIFKSEKNTSEALKQLSSHHLKKEYVDFAREIHSKKEEFSLLESSNLLHSAGYGDEKYWNNILRLIEEPGLTKADIIDISKNFNENMNEMVLQVLKNPDIPRDQVKPILRAIRSDSQLLFAKKMLDRYKEFESDPEREDVVFEADKSSQNEFLGILRTIRHDNIDFAFDLIKDFNNYPRNFIERVLFVTHSDNISFAYELVKNFNKYPQEFILGLLTFVDSSNIDFVREKLNDPGFPRGQILGYVALSSPFVGSHSIKEVYDSLPLNQSEDPSGVNNIEYLAKEVEAAKEKVLNHLDLYANGDMLTPNSRREVQMQLNLISGALLVMRSIFDKSTFDAFLRQRLQTVEQYLSLTERSFSPKDFELLKKLNNPNLTNASGKPLSSKQKIKMIDLIMAYKNLGTDTKIIEDAADTGKIDIGALNIEMLKAVLSKGGLSKEELKNATAENLGFDFSQLHFLAVQLNSSDIVNPFDDLLRAAVLGDFREYINDETNDYGRVNAETKEQFMQAGMDYDKWVNPEKSAEVIFNTQTLSVTDIVEEISSAVEELRRHNKFIKTALDKALRENIVNDKFVLRPEETTNAVELNKFIEKFKEITSNTRNRAEQSKTSSDALRRVNAEKTLSLLDRVELQSAKINELQTLKKQKGNMNVKIKMWDRVPQKDIFQGNYSTCCIGMAGGNGHFMPYYLMNTAFNMIEIVENTENPITDENGNITGYAEGNTIGNALCYFVLDSDGKPAFVVDNIEINNSKKPSGETALQLRDKITEYAANVAKSVTGRDDVNIYLSENYNDVPCDDLPKVDSSVKLVGKTNASRIYLDLYGGATDSADLEAFTRLPNKRKLGTVKDFT